MPRKLAPVTQVLPIPKDTYDVHYMRNLVAMIQRAMHSQEEAATLRGGWINLSEIRYDAYGLIEGDGWVDNGYLKIVGQTGAGLLGSGLTVSVGTVTVTVV